MIKKSISAFSSAKSFDSDPEMAIALTKGNRNRKFPIEYALGINFFAGNFLLSFYRPTKDYHVMNKNRYVKKQFYLKAWIVIQARALHQKKNRE
jgi:hypothetical protein